MSPCAHSKRQTVSHSLWRLAPVLLCAFPCCLCFSFHSFLFCASPFLCFALFRACAFPRCLRSFLFVSVLPVLCSLLLSSLFLACACALRILSSSFLSCSILSSMGQVPNLRISSRTNNQQTKKTCPLRELLKLPPPVGRCLRPPRARVSTTRPVLPPWKMARRTSPGVSPPSGSHRA